MAMRIFELKIKAFPQTVPHFHSFAYTFQGKSFSFPLDYTIAFFGYHRDRSSITRIENVNGRKPQIQINFDMSAFGG
jgi:hypothetical protein